TGGPGGGGPEPLPSSWSASSASGRASRRARLQYRDRGAAPASCFAARHHCCRRTTPVRTNGPAARKKLRTLLPGTCREGTMGRSPREGGPGWSARRTGLAHAAHPLACQEEGPMSESKVRLRVVQGKPTGKTLVLSRGDYYVGRGAEC